MYLSEMGITLFSAIDRYSLEGARVELTYHLRVSKKRNLAMFAAEEKTVYVPLADLVDDSLRCWKEYNQLSFA